ncbi:hypothetical protein BCR32DRAFT_264544 [Anaeromyces robustus]|uniref:Extracellular membrane protein CFEM domain-containing protein n=1 Tax=Anaeromyces robustus TaxID=1754192 RepID=A0A1Y1XMS0_9FUNG|nr:hypothetical protein BCR32DRAFT_264544 [Anaeromyces robustus]|eukprot:ORX87060.1 hypothetical protein BCR32DRAFT_264544 [Anaeromyces robustus]
MNIKSIVFIISLIKLVSGNISTPSGNEIPDSLLTYLDCPIGDVSCKNKKGSSCNAHSNVCRNGNPTILGEILLNSGYNIGDLTPEEYCTIHLEVCDMILTYDPPITDDDVFNYNKYFSCDKDDNMCIFDKTSSCQTVLKYCPNTYSEEDCNKLSIVCDSIQNGEIPVLESTNTISTTTSIDEQVTTTTTITTATATSIDEPIVTTQDIPTDVTTSSGTGVPDFFLKYLDCPIGDGLCKNEKISSCEAHSSICKYATSDTLGEMLKNSNIDIGNFTPEEYCKVHLEVCDMISTYDPPLTDDDVYNFDKYLTCNTDDIVCIFSKSSICLAVLKLCPDYYSKEDCDTLSNVCNTIQNSAIPDISSLTPENPEPVNVDENDDIFTSIISNKQLTTPSGTVIPDSLLIYLDCPIGNVICKNNKSNSCTSHLILCNSKPNTLSETLSANGYDIGNLSPEKYCEVHKEVCDMVLEYEPPLTDEYIYDLDRYLTCDSDDTICQYGQKESCKSVLELCWTYYHDSDCINLSNVCDKVYGNNDILIDSDSLGNIDESTNNNNSFSVIKVVKAKTTKMVKLKTNSKKIKKVKTLTRTRY